MPILARLLRLLKISSHQNATPSSGAISVYRIFCKIFRPAPSYIINLHYPSSAFGHHSRLNSKERRPSSASTTQINDQFRHRTWTRPTCFFARNIATFTRIFRHILFLYQVNFALSLFSYHHHHRPPSSFDHHMPLFNNHLQVFRSHILLSTPL
jgi:hypothetical protein